MASMWRPLATLTHQQVAYYRAHAPQLIVDFVDAYDGTPTAVPLATGDMAGIANVDELVLAIPVVDVVIDYPLRQPLVFRLHSSDRRGWTRGELAWTISHIYQYIYSTNDPTWGLHGAYIDELLLRRIKYVGNDLVLLVVTLELTS